MGNDKWDKVIKHLRSSNRDPDKVLKLLKGSDKGIETSYSISRSSYALNVIALITQKISAELRPELCRYPSQRANREYFRKTKGRVLIKPTTAPKEIFKEIKNKSFHSSLIKLK